MKTIRGKKTSFLNTLPITPVHLDLGTGDGRFVQHLAQQNPSQFIVGVDACRENLRKASQRAPENALFLIANAEALPPGLDGAAAQVTINFPWGSLITGLLDDHPGLMDGLRRVMCPGGRLEIRLNGGALAEAGWTLEAGAEQVRDALMMNGFRMASPVMLDASDLKIYPTTWAKRLAFGRDPRAVWLCGEA